MALNDGGGTFVFLSGGYYDLLSTGTVPYLFFLCQGLLRFPNERKAPEKLFESFLVPMRYQYRLHESCSYLTLPFGPYLPIF
jgi:hypothetical protein